MRDTYGHEWDEMYRGGGAICRRCKHRRDSIEARHTCRPIDGSSFESTTPMADSIFPLSSNPVDDSPSYNSGASSDTGSSDGGSSDSGSFDGGDSGGGGGGSDF